MEILKVMMENLILNHIFAYADEQVCARLTHIIWKEVEVILMVMSCMSCKCSKKLPINATRFKDLKDDL